MSNTGEKGSWWSTLPRILTGVAAVITAGGGVIALFLSQHPTQQAGPEVKQPLPGSSTAKRQDAPQADTPSSQPLALGPKGESEHPVTDGIIPWDKAVVTVVLNDGQQTKLRAMSTTVKGGLDTFEFENGQRFGLKDLRSVSLHLLDSAYKMEATVETLSGQRVSGLLSGSYVYFEFGGESDAGDFSVRLTKVRRIEFGR
jgi:hypothetical protein